MINFIKCFCYCTIIGISSNFIGFLLPRRWFDDRRFIFRCASWERGGRIYDKLKVRAWKDKMPDVSRLIKSMVPKRISGKAKLEELETLIAESCVAEIIHWGLIIAGLPLLIIWRGLGGIICYIIWSLGNLVFVIIQRYNRPRFRAVCDRLMRAEAAGRFKASAEASNAGKADKKEETLKV